MDKVGTMLLIVFICSIPVIITAIFTAIGYAIAVWFTAKVARMGWGK